MVSTDDPLTLTNPIFLWESTGSLRLNTYGDLWGAYIKIEVYP